jgi:DNA-binding transcriptional ArsR family regulator
MTDTDGDPIDPDPDAEYRVEAFDVLSHQRRVLAVLALLLIPAEEVSVKFLAEVIAVFTTEQSPRDLSAVEYNRTRQSLLKSHLDPLEAAGVVRVEGNSIFRGPAFTRYCSLVLTEYLTGRVLFSDTDRS